MARGKKVAPGAGAEQRAVLVNVGIITAAGEVIGAEAASPDAVLLADIARYRVWHDQCDRAWRLARNKAERGRAIVDGQGLCDLANDIAETPAHTVAGLHAKLAMVLEQLEHGDRAFDRNFYLYVPAMVVREALASSAWSLAPAAAGRAA